MSANVAYITSDPLKVLLAKIIVAEYRNKGIDRFKGTDALADLRAHGDYAALYRHHPGVRSYGLRGAILYPVIQHLPFKGKGVLNGERALRLVPVQGEREGDIVFTDVMTPNDWGAIRTRQMSRRDGYDRSIDNLKQTLDFMEREGIHTIADLYGRMGIAI